MRWILLVCLLAGCRQIFGLEDPQHIGDAASSDARAVDAAPDAVLMGSCSADSNLVACYDFEGNVNDSAPVPNTTSGVSVSFVPGKLGKALSLTATSRVSIADSMRLDVSAETMEAWIHPTQLPTGSGRAGIIDIDGQYAMFLYPGGLVSCIAGGTLQSAQAVPVNTWTHVACSTGADSIKLYLNGMQVAVFAMPAPLVMSSTTGGEIGGNAPDGVDRLVGLIDTLRIYRVERTAADIAADAAP